MREQTRTTDRRHVIYIFAVHMIGGARHEHIAKVRWKNADDGSSGESTRAEMVDFIGRKGGSAYVCAGNAHVAKVGIVDGNQSYLRTHADGVWSDNLLALPRY